MDEALAVMSVMWVTTKHARAEFVVGGKFDDIILSRTWGWGLSLGFLVNMLDGAR